ncbi:MAG TPA: cytochrome c-type biogenesis protein [Thermoanaerobaculia bacterium]|nr:cytochrome c-type biogenesis protein [Thermoanaerobaculia bacterium]
MIFLLLLAVALGPPQGRPLSGAPLEQRTYEVASLLRCPVCQGMSVADSPSTVALDMKQQVREMLSRGYTQEQILDFFEQSYGQFVLLKPQNPFVWILPVVVLLVGIAIVVIKARRLTSDNREPTTENQYINRVRELVEKE